MFDESALYDSGMTIMTSLDEDIQVHAEESFIKGINEFSKRQGWKGPLTNLNVKKDFLKKLKSIKKPEGLFDKHLGVITKINKSSVEVLLRKDQKIRLKSENLSLIKEKISS